MPHPDHSQMLHDLWDAPALWADYDVYPDAFTFGLALRRWGPHRAPLLALFRERFAAAYPGLRLDDHRATARAP